MKKSYAIELGVCQIRILRCALEKYIRNHDIILHDCRFTITEMKFLFSDLSKYCELCETLDGILRGHDSQPLDNNGDISAPITAADAAQGEKKC